MDIVEKLCPVDLRPAVMRTLAVIALKEPIRQTDLKELRGSTAYEHVAEPVSYTHLNGAGGDKSLVTSLVEHLKCNMT